jgi:hypothetical protein
MADLTDYLTDSEFRVVVDRSARAKSGVNKPVTRGKAKRGRAPAPGYAELDDVEPAFDPNYLPPGEPIEAPTAAEFKCVSDFCSEYEPISYSVEPFLRSSSLYALTARTGAGKTALFVTLVLAAATGRGDLLGREVTQGRVAYIAAENPDDLRMRIMAAAYNFNINLAEVGDLLVILDKRTKPDDLLIKLRRLAATGKFSLIIIDTVAAFFDGDNINDPVQGGEFMRRLRPLTQINGKPAVIVAAHPKKNAMDDELVPYGAGAILNEIDGNLTLRKALGGATELHWQGKLRGVEFEPLSFRFDLLASPDVKDVRGREVLLPVLRPMAEADVEQRENEAVNRAAAILTALRDQPGASLSALAAATGIPKPSVDRTLKRLATRAAGNLVKKTLGKWIVTPAGQQAIEVSK